EAHDQPDRHDHDGAEQEVAPDPAQDIEAHLPDTLDEAAKAGQDVPRIEAQRREHDADQDRQENEAEQSRHRRAAEEARRVVDHPVPPHPDGLLVARAGGSARGPGSPRALGSPREPWWRAATSSSSRSSVSSRSASPGGLSQRRRLMRGNRMASPDLW